jgi:Rrf2 family protein
MLGLTKKVDYGLELMLALAKGYQRQPLSLREISQQNRLPYNFLAQVAVQLRRAGLIEAKEGSRGGYFLTSAPEKITLTDVVEALGTNEQENCDLCKREGICRPRQIWLEMENEMIKKLDQRTLKDLIK